MTISGTLGSCGDRNTTDQRVLHMAKYSHRMVPEIFQTFWSGMAAGEFITGAAEAAGSYRKQGARWLAACGGVRPRRGRNLKGRCLTFAEREEIAIGIAAGHTLRDIAKALNRSPSTITREIARNREPSGRYRARSAHAAAYHRASRPKPSKLATNPSLRETVEKSLTERHSPEQIAGRLRLDFPDDPQMRVSTETIYQSLYQPSRGGLEHTPSPDRCGPDVGCADPVGRPASARIGSPTWPTLRTAPKT